MKIDCQSEICNGRNQEVPAALARLVFVKDVQCDNVFLRFRCTNCQNINLRVPSDELIGKLQSIVKIETVDMASARKNDGIPEEGSLDPIDVLAFDIDLNIGTPVDILAELHNDK